MTHQQTQPGDTKTAAILAELLGSGTFAARITAGQNGEFYLAVTEEEFTPAIESLAARKCVLIGLFCVQDFSPRSRFSLLYVFEKKSSILILIRDCAGTATSIARIFPSANWFERECRDGFGIEFSGAFDKRRLFLHETYPEQFHPLTNETPNRPVTPKKQVAPEEEYPFRTVHGEGVYQIPVGPVHAGIIEPGHFRFSVIGETIFNLEVRMFYKHRGIEKLAQGKTPQECVAVAEAISGDESVAHAVALCIATEKISGISIPPRALYLRTILLELERMYSHLGDQAGMLVDVAFPLGANQFSVLREDLMRMNAILTGSRFLRGVVTQGGLTKDIRKQDLQVLLDFIQKFTRRYQVGLKIVLSTTSLLDRFTTTGRIPKELLRPLNITGPAGRASGGKVDIRISHPYGIYDTVVPVPRRLHDGDVLARFTVKAAEVLDSARMIEQLITGLPEGPVHTDQPVRDGYALSVVESARGQDLCWLWVRNGMIERYKVRTASFCNWQAIEHAVIGEILPDFPVINKSLNLSYAGTDL
ncbi:MAG: hydrogenase large subunit [Methanomicrobiales archaeon]|nr:hydrogenase large subunit [Methanomicrobiales archaeon]